MKVLNITEGREVNILTLVEEWHTDYGVYHINCCWMLGLESSGYWRKCPIPYLGQRGLTPAGLPHTTAQCHLTVLGEAVLFCLNHPSFQTPGSLSFCCRPFCRYGRRGATFSVSLSAVGFLSIESFCTILH